MVVPVNSRKCRLLNIVDGGSLVELGRKGNLAYADTLYNPGNFFEKVYHIVFRREDLTVKLRNKTITLCFLRRTRPVPKMDFLISTSNYLYQMIQIIRRWRVDIMRSRAPFVKL